MTASAEPKSLLKIAPVEKGAGVSVIAPAASAKLERAEQGMKHLRALGFLPSLGRNALQKGIHVVV